jgi:hypothetical protein
MKAANRPSFSSRHLLPRSSAHQASKQALKWIPVTSTGLSGWARGGATAWGLNPPWIEKRTHGADMETAVLRPHLCGWLAWIPAFAGMTSVGRSVPSKQRHARGGGHPRHLEVKARAGLRHEFPPAEPGSHVTSTGMARYPIGRSRCPDTRATPLKSDPGTPET